MWCVVIKLKKKNILFCENDCLIVSLEKSLLTVSAFHIVYPKYLAAALGVGRRHLFFCLRVLVRAWVLYLKNKGTILYSPL